MKDFKGKIAVVTGAGTGMGRELARQLAAEGCDVAICEFIVDNMNETRRLCEAEALPGTRILAQECDVSEEDQVIAFRDSVMREFATEHINLLFNNAGVGGGSSYVLEDRKIFDKAFAVNWFGVYYNVRAFMPMLLKSSQGHIINTSSVNGFWACLGPQTPHVSYSAAKFAVKGFTEGLLVDLRLNAPHIKASVVMPGHVGTSIGINTRIIHGFPDPDEVPDDHLDAMRERMKTRGFPLQNATNDQLREMLKHQGEQFRDNAPVSSAQAATIILDGVRNGQWRILIGEDAKRLDMMARNHAEQLYDQELYSQMLQDFQAEGD